MPSQPVLTDAGHAAKVREAAAELSLRVTAARKHGLRVRLTMDNNEHTEHEPVEFDIRVTKEL
jgi:hypothetical protein